jgi:hypothetical protein
MSKPLAVVLADDNYECLELHYPRLRLLEAGFRVEVRASKVLFFFAPSSRRRSGLWLFPERKKMRFLTSLLLFVLFNRGRWPETRRATTTSRRRV